MATHRARHLVRNLLDEVPWPSTVLGLLAVVIVGLFLAGSTLQTNDDHPVHDMPSQTATVALTPDDPGAANSVPAQMLGH
jgi:hypothetical protein